MPGHGNIRLSEEEIIILREFLLRGAFLHADDNYGMNESFRREMKRGSNAPDVFFEAFFEGFEAFGV